MGAAGSNSRGFEGMCIIIMIISLLKILGLTGATESTGVFLFGEGTYCLEDVSYFRMSPDAMGGFSRQ